jgi:hypothetical protein
VGAVVGLYPFRAPTPPAVGQLHRGVVLSAEEVARLAPKHWPLERFDPSAAQVAAAIALVMAGLGTTLAVDRIGGGGDEHAGPPRES